MTPQEREVMQMALDALETITSKVAPMSYYCSFAVEIESLRAALAQPEQEPVWGDSQVTKPEIVAEQKAMNEGLRKMVEQKPVAWRKKWEGDEDYTYYWMNRYKGSEPLYTAPPQREWQGLTEMEVLDICNFAQGQNGFFFVREVEAKLKEKNT